MAMQVLFKKAFAQSFVSKKHICINQRFQVYKIVQEEKEAELSGPISKKGPHLSFQGEFAPLPPVSYATGSPSSPKNAFL